MTIADGKTTLYERIGGADAVARCLDRFYLGVLADDELRPYFDHADLDGLRRMQAEFFAAALDGPIRYADRPVIHAHHGRHITRRHFQAFVEHLFAALAGFGLSEDDRYAIIARVNTYVDDVIGSASGPVE